MAALYGEPWTTIMASWWFLYMPGKSPLAQKGHSKCSPYISVKVYGMLCIAMQHYLKHPVFLGLLHFLRRASCMFKGLLFNGCSNVNATFFRSMDVLQDITSILPKHGTPICWRKRRGFRIRNCGRPWNSNGNPVPGSVIWFILIFLILPSADWKASTRKTRAPLCTI